jgi:hypothetical protein
MICHFLFITHLTEYVSTFRVVIFLRYRNYFLEHFNCILGVSWVDMHKLANRVLLAELCDAGLLQGEVDDMMKVSARQLRNPFLM